MLPKLDWRRILIDGAVIVFSILLAFAIDASWNGRQERSRAAALTTALRHDVVETRAHIRRLLARRERIMRDARTILETLAAGVGGPQRDSVLVGVGSVFVLTGWTPATGTYEQALGSGDLALIRSPEVRRRLARYQAALADVGRTSDFVATQYYGQLEPFLVEHTVYSELASRDWREQLVQGPRRTDFDALATSLPLWNLVTLKLELEAAMVRNLATADSAAAALLEVLPGAAP